MKRDFWAREVALGIGDWWQAGPWPVLGTWGKYLGIQRTEKRVRVAVTSTCRPWLWVRSMSKVAHIVRGKLLTLSEESVREDRLKATTQLGVAPAV